jgi:hypothetical protein
MFKKRFSDWNISKYVRQRDLPLISGQIAAYREEHGKSPIAVSVNGRYVDAAKVARSLKRHRIRRRKIFGRSDTSTPSVSTTSSSGTTIDPHEKIVSQTEAGTRARYPGGGQASNEIYNCASRLSRRIRIHDLLCDYLEPQEDLTAEELTVLHVAILQTDFHCRDSELSHPSSAKRHLMVTSTQGPNCHFSTAMCGTNFWIPSQPAELQDLAFVLHESNVYYDFVADRRGRSGVASYLCSPTEKTQARDFYARYWLGLSLVAKADAKQREKMYKTAFSLFGQACDQIGLALQEDHPHFLPWVCFLVCYPETWKAVGNLERLQNHTLEFTLKMTEVVDPQNHPRWKIQNRIKATAFRRHICLVLLRKIVAVFRQETQDAHLESLQVLAQLFDHIDQHDHFDAIVIEETLQRWGMASKDIANIIQTEKLKRWIA